MKKPLCEKNSPAISTDCRAPNVYVSQTRGQLLSIKLASNGLQSIPQLAAKSSAKLKRNNARKLV